MYLCGFITGNVSGRRHRLILQLNINKTLEKFDETKKSTAGEIAEI